MPELQNLSGPKNLFTGKLPNFNKTPKINTILFNSNNLEGCIPLWACTIQFTLNENPKMPWNGLYEENLCALQLPQIGAPCNDGNPDTQNDVIQSDCRCGEGAPCTNPTIQISATVCEGHTYSFRGNTYGFGVSEVRLPGPSACDTIVTLTITQGDQPKENVQGLVCSGETFQYRGQQYAFGSHHLTYPGALCDTIYTIVVDTLPQPKTTETREVCTGKLTVYRGQQFSVGTYNFSFPGPVCDTLITLKVTIPK